MSTAGRLDLSPGAAVVLDGAEWLVEQAEPHHARVVLVGSGGARMTVSFRFLINHPNCRPSVRAAAVLQQVEGDEVGRVLGCLAWQAPSSGEAVPEQVERGPADMRVPDDDYAVDDGAGRQLPGHGVAKVCWQHRVSELSECSLN